MRFLSLFILLSILINLSCGRDIQAIRENQIADNLNNPETDKPLENQEEKADDPADKPSSDDPPTNMNENDKEIVDQNKDGVEDSEDNCPDRANVDQLNNDKDLFGDECDIKPWKITILSEKKIALRANSRKFVRANNGGGDSVDVGGEAISIWETFTLIYYSDGKYAFKTYNGHYLKIENGAINAKLSEAERANMTTVENFIINKIENSKNLVNIATPDGKKLISEKDNMLILTQDKPDKSETFVLIDLEGEEVVIKDYNGDYVLPVEQSKRLLLQGRYVPVTFNLIADEYGIDINNDSDDFFDSRIQIIDLGFDEIALRTYDFSYVGVYDTYKGNSYVKFRKKTIGISEAFQLQKATSEMYTIKSVFNEQFLCSDDRETDENKRNYILANRDNNAPCTNFQIIPIK